MTCFIDTSVVRYAGGADHPYRAACRAVMRQVADETLDAVTSAEVVQEIQHRCARGHHRAGAQMARSVLGLFSEVLPIDRRTIAGAVAIYEDHPHLSARDALHVATCVTNDIADIVSVDAGFDEATEVRRIDPRDLLKP